jgi:hypothetical protein
MKTLSILAFLLATTFNLFAATEPTVPTSNITFSNVQTTQMTINWSKGNGTNRLVIVKSGSAVSKTPTDGIAYSANPQLGSGTNLGLANYAVYNSTGSSVTVTNLTTSTTYYIAIFEFNGTGTGINYLTSTIVTTNQSTLASAPSTPASISISSATYNNHLLSFTAPGTVPSGYILLRKIGSAVTGLPVDGTIYTVGQTNIGTGTNEVVYVGSTVLTNSIQSNLQDSTKYYYSVFSYNGSGSSRFNSQMQQISSKMHKIF